MTEVNTRAAHNSVVARMGRLSADIDTAMAQIGTGKRVQAPSDDPVAYSRATAVRRAQAEDAAGQRGIDAANRRLTATDNALESITNLVQRARELALQGANGTLSSENRAIVATELRELQASFATLADSRGSDGERLFGGAAADRPAYALDADGIMRWQGAGAAPRLRIGDAEVATGIEGPAAFGVTDAPDPAVDPLTQRKDLFATFTLLIEGLAEPDTALRSASVTRSIDLINGHVTRLADARAATGARLARLESDGERIEKAKLAGESDLSKLESVDMSEAIARLQRLTLVLEAAQASFAKTSSLSLWDALR
ncbi:MAG: hypothetical protein RL490_1407 [Pseudomonadota bacterium]